MERSTYKHSAGSESFDVGSPDVTLGIVLATIPVLYRHEVGISRGRLNFGKKAQLYHTRFVQPTSARTLYYDYGMLTS
jgi:hypothetical protein